MIEKVKVYKDQNIVDLAIQEYGSIEGLVAMCRQNNASVDGTLGNISPLLVDTDEVVNATTRSFFKNAKYIVATGEISDENDTFDESFDQSFN